MSECRKATMDDVDLLVTLMREFHSRSPLAKYKFSPSGSRNYFKAMIRDPNSVIIMHDDGMIVGGVSEYPFCEMKIGKEALWYARKQGLGGTVLLKDYMVWMENKGADVDLLSSINIDDQSMASVERLLRIVKYNPIERTFMRVN